MIRLAMERLLHFDRIAGKVGRRRPEARRRHLRIGMRASFDGLAVGNIRSCRVFTKGGWQRLFVSATRHADGREHGIMQQFRIRLFGKINESLLHDRKTAARILPAFARCRFTANRLGVGRLLAIEHLHQRRHRRAARVTGKAMYVDTRGVRNKSAQRDRLTRSHRRTG